MKYTHVIYSQIIYLYTYMVLCMMIHPEKTWIIFKNFFQFEFILTNWKIWSHKYENSSFYPIYRFHVNWIQTLHYAIVVSNSMSAFASKDYFVMFPLWRFPITLPVLYSILSIFDEQTLTIVAHCKFHQNIIDNSWKGMYFSWRLCLIGYLILV